MNKLFGTTTPTEEGFKKFLVRYLQRDLEDQIDEEYKAKGLVYKRTQMAEKQKVTVSEIIDLLGRGYTRYKKDDRGYGSIEEKYKLTAGEVAKIFQHEKLKGLMTKKPLSITLVDDTVAQESEIPPLPVRQATASEQAEAVAILASEGVSRAEEEVENKLQDLFS